MSVLSNNAIKLAIYYVTVPTRQAGDKLSQLLIGEKLIACCTIINAVDSKFMWEGKVNSETEFLMVMKSRESLANEITETVIKNHPYEVP